MQVCTATLTSNSFTIPLLLFITSKMTDYQIVFSVMVLVALNIMSLDSGYDLPSFSLEYREYFLPTLTAAIYN